MHQLHDKVGQAGVRSASVENAGDVGVIHHGQRLALAFEAGDDLPAVHSGLDDFEGDLAPDWLELLRLINDAHAAFADGPDQTVRTDGGLFRRRIRAGRDGGGGRLLNEKGFDFGEEIGVVAAGFTQKCAAPEGVQLSRRRDDFGCGHDWA
jgi:hypothetical protein